MKCVFPLLNNNNNNYTTAIVAPKINELCTMIFIIEKVKESNERKRNTSLVRVRHGERKKLKDEDEAFNCNNFIRHKIHSSLGSLNNQNQPTNC